MSDPTCSLSVGSYCLADIGIHNEVNTINKVFDNFICSPCVCLGLDPNPQDDFLVTFGSSIGMLDTKPFKV